MKLLRTTSLLFLQPLLAYCLPTMNLDKATLKNAMLLARDGSTENGLSTDACKAVTLIFARGTNEAGNVGSIAGPPFFATLRSAAGTGQVTVQGVDYSADVIGYLEGGDPAGSATMLSLIQQASKKCPSTKIVLSGYSQGAQLVHNAASKLSSAITAQVAAVVMFGDPDHALGQNAVGAVPGSKVLSICHAGDIICNGFGEVAPHLTYNLDNGTAAAFVESKTGI